MKNKGLATIGAFAALVAGGVAAPATASAAPRAMPRPQTACGPGDYGYKAVGDTYKFTRAKGRDSAVQGDPGVTLTISRSTTFSVAGTLGGTSSISGSIIVATVQQQLNYSITATYSGTSTSSGAWKVPDSYKNGGRLEIGARKHSGAVQKYKLKPDCSYGKLVDAASYNAPEEGWYFHHSKL